MKFNINEINDNGSYIIIKSSEIYVKEDDPDIITKGASLEHSENKKNIDYKKLADKLSFVLDYDNGDRPEDICEELMIEYGKYYDVDLFHGSMLAYEDIRKYYSGFASCSRDFDVAKRFSEFDQQTDNYSNNGTIVKIKGPIFAVNISELIKECYMNLKYNVIAEYIYDAYFSEDEYLVYAEDMITQMTELKEE